MDQNGTAELKRKSEIDKNDVIQVSRTVSRSKMNYPVHKL